MNPSTLLAVLQLFSVCFRHLRYLDDDDSYIPILICCRQLLIGHVIVALHVVMSDSTEPLSKLKLICHLFAHSTNVLIYSSSSIMSSGFLALLQSLVSSENLNISLTILVFRSFYIWNSSRPNTLPCGTPHMTGARLQLKIIVVICNNYKLMTGWCNKIQS